MKLIKFFPGLLRLTKKYNISFYLLAFLLVGLLLRIYQIGHLALHHDEAYSMNGIMTPSWEALKNHLQCTDIFPPLAYFIQKAFYRFFPTVTAMRFVSTLAGMLAIVIAYWALLPLVNRRRALLLVGVCATSYIMIWYSREVRSYIFHFVAVILTIGFLVRISLSSQKWPPLTLLAGFLISNILGLYFHYNMLLAWPILGATFIVWEFFRVREGERFRWNYLLVLTAVGLLALLSMVPLLPLFLKAIKFAGGETVRPPLSLIYRKLCCTGWGTGWLGILWSILLILGAVRAFRVNKRAFTLFSLCTIGTVLIYIYIIGFPINFSKNIQKYTFLFTFGALFAAVYGIEELTSLVLALIRRISTCRIKPIFINIAILAVLVGLATPTFSRYYALGGASYLFKDFQRNLEELGPRNLLIDNYYDLQYIRHYLPPSQRIAYPPIYGSGEEFKKNGDAAFIQKVVTSDPLFAFWDSRMARTFGEESKAQWGWLDDHFMHCATLYNTNGVFLNRKALNFHAFQEDETGDMRPPHIYYNTPDDLPKWFRNRNIPYGTAFGANWYHLTYLGLDNQWRHSYVTADQGTFYVCNATTSSAPVRLSIQLAGCTPQQSISLSRDNQLVNHVGLRSQPVNGFDFRTQQKFQQHIPFGNVFRSSGGLLSLPVALNIQYTSLVATNIMLPPGSSLFKLSTPAPEGLLVQGISVSGQQ